jgi:hypothetical protein
VGVIGKQQSVTVLDGKRHDPGIALFDLACIRAAPA